MNLRQILLPANEVFITPLLGGISAFIGFYNSEFNLTASISFSFALFFFFVYMKRLRFTP